MLGDVAQAWAAFASLGAGLVHLSVVREHAEHWWAQGAFLLIVGLLQLAWAVAALCLPRAPFRRAFSGLTMGLVLTWVVSRTAGLPFGPDAGVAEPVGVSDGLAVVLEIGVLAALVLSRWRGSARDPVHGRHAAAVVGLLFTGALGVSALTVPALAASDAGEHAHHGSHRNHSG